MGLIPQSRARQGLWGAMAILPVIAVEHMRYRPRNAKTGQCRRAPSNLTGRKPRAGQASRRYATQNPKPCTRNPKPETRNPRLETRNPKPETRNPNPETQKKTKHQTRNSKPETPSPKPYALNLTPRILSPEPLTPNHKPETLNPDALTLSTPNPNSKSTAFRSDSGAP